MALSSQMPALESPKTRLPSAGLLQTLKKLSVIRCCETVNDKFVVLLAELRVSKLTLVL